MMIARSVLGLYYGPPAAFTALAIVEGADDEWARNSDPSFVDPSAPKPVQ
jgi:hypothetical protein